MTYYVASSVFAERWNDFDNAEKESAHLSLEAWERLFGGDRELKGRNMIEVNSTDGQQVYTVGIPYMAHSSDEIEKDVLYLPNINYCIDDNFIAGIRVIERSEIPDAASITFKVHDKSFHEIDYKEELEKILSCKAILEIGNTIDIMGYTLNVVDLKPSRRVFCDGEEVEILFEMPIAPVIPDFPIESSGFIPFSGKGQRLGD